MSVLVYLLLSILIVIGQLFPLFVMTSYSKAKFTNSKPISWNGN